METHIDNSSEVATKAVTEDEMKAATKATESLAKAMKVSALYPKKHPNYGKALARAQTHLEAFVQMYGKFRLEVKRDRLLYAGEVVHEAPPGADNLAFVLSRDGIQWLEFRNGIDMDEVKDFLEMLNKYRELPEEADGDIVTALWEAQLPHLRYAALDILIDADPLTKDIFSDNKVQADVKLTLQRDLDIPDKPDVETIEHLSLGLSLEEETNINEMVLYEEKRKIPGQVLVMFLDILRGQQDRELFVTVLEFVEEGFQDAMLQGDFDFARKILQGLGFLLQLFRKQKHWAVPLLEKSFQTASSPKALQPLQEIWPYVGPKRAEEIREVLKLLLPEANLTLGPMLGLTSSSAFRQMLMDVVESLAIREIRPFESLLYHSKGDVMPRLIQVLSRLKGDKPTQILLALIKHTSDQVRKEAVKALTTRGHWDPEQLFPLMDDENEQVRLQVLKYLERNRSEAVEDFLMDYLGHKTTRHEGDAVTFACFKALGGCGTKRSVPFLRDVLFHNAWLSLFRRSTRRQYAAIALNTLEADEAKYVLKEASQSHFPGIRRATREVATLSGHVGVNQ